MSRRGSKGPTDRTSCAASGRRFGWNPADRHELPSGPPVGAPGPALHGTHTSNCVARIAAATWRSAFGRTTQLAETPAEAAPPRRTACRDSVTRPPLRPRAGPTVVACARHPFTGVCYPGTASRSRRGPRPSRLRGLRAPPLALVRVHTGLMRHSAAYDWRRIHSATPQRNALTCRNGCAYLSGEGSLRGTPDVPPASSERTLCHCPRRHVELGGDR